MNYEELVQEGLRDVVKEIFKRIEKDGLTGNHHIYLTFLTNYPGVKIPEYLRERHPRDITIVLQYQFWGLKVHKDHFEITLSFNDVHEDLRIPFKAIIGLVDPSVKFGLQLNPAYEEAESHLLENEIEEIVEKPKKAEKKKAAKKSAPSGDEAKPKGGEETNIISLDTFRKKD